MKRGILVSIWMLCMFYLVANFMGQYIQDNAIGSNYENENSVSLASSTTNVDDVSYKVVHYFQDLEGEYKYLEGEYEETDIKIEELSAPLGTEVTAAYKEDIIGFQKDENNEDTILSGIVSNEEPLVLKLYYARKTFEVHINNVTEQHIIGNCGSLYYEDETAVNESIFKIPFGSSIYLEEDNTLVVGRYKFVPKAISDTVEFRYSFAGWEFKNIELNTDGKYVINNENTSKISISYSFTREIQEYEITWKNGNTILATEIYEYGETPKYELEEPTKLADVQYTYSFSGWTPNIETVKGDMTYEANYNKTLNKYRISFEVENEKLGYGTVSHKELYVDYGTIISISQANSEVLKVGVATSVTAKPTTDTMQYDYSVYSWEIEDSILDNNSNVIVIEELVVRVSFQRNVKQYSISWINGVEKLEIDMLSYGEMPEYNGKTPEKAATAEFSYVFTGWGLISKVEGDKDYYAQYEEIINKYEVKWKIEGKVVETDSDVPYGTLAEYNGSEPSLPSGDNYYYVFEGWNKDVTEVTEDVTYEAVFSKFFTVNISNKDKDVSLKSSGLGEGIVFSAEKLSENRLFVLPEGMEAVVTYKSSLLKGNENYHPEEELEIIIDLGDDYDESRIYHVYINLGSQIIEKEVTPQGSLLSFKTDVIGDFVIYTEKIQHVSLIWLIVLFVLLIVGEACFFYFIIVKKYRQYKRQIDLKLNSTCLIALLLTIRVTSTPEVVFSIILGVLALGIAGFIGYCLYSLKKMKESLPVEEEEFIYIPNHDKEELEVETCPVYTGPKRDFSKLPKQTYYDMPYRPIYYYQPNTFYQNQPITENEEEVNDDEIIIENGSVVRIHYNRSFMSRVIQGSKDVQDYYTKIKNEVAAYSKLKSRIGWEHETVYSSRETILKLKIRNEVLCAFLALDPSKYSKSRLNFEDVGKIKKYKNVPMLIKINDDKDYQNVIKLLDQICKKQKLIKSEIGNEDYHYEYRNDLELVEEGLIKEIKTSSEEVVSDKEEILTGDMISSKINLADAQAALTDEEALALIESSETETTVSGKKTVINIGTLSRFFEANEVVNLASLKEKKIVSKDTGYVKILASGVLDKPLIVEANSYSIDAVKMIVLTGGKVKMV